MTFRHKWRIGIKRYIFSHKWKMGIKMYTVKPLCSRTQEKYIFDFFRYKQVLYSSCLYLKRFATQRFKRERCYSMLLWLHCSLFHLYFQGYINFRFYYFLNIIRMLSFTVCDLWFKLNYIYTELLSGFSIYHESFKQLNSIFFII